jgi:hypothetical protein
MPKIHGSAENPPAPLRRNFRGSFMPKTHRRHYAGIFVAPLCRNRNGSIPPQVHNSAGNMIAEIKKGDQAGHFDPRGFYFTDQGEMLIADASTEILRATPQDFTSMPRVVPTGAGTYEIGTPITVGGQVSDLDGKTLTFAWSEGAPLPNCSGTISTSQGGALVDLPDCVLPALGLGSHTVTLTVTVANETSRPVSSSIVVKVVDTTAPTLAPVPNPSLLWPPNHKMVPITIATHASDNSGSLTLGATVASNEPQNGLGDGDTAPDWTTPAINQTTGVINLQLRAERSGGGNGRAYTIAITATDPSGNTSTKNVVIFVPHDKGKK